MATQTTTVSSADIKAVARPSTATTPAVKSAAQPQGGNVTPVDTTSEKRDTQNKGAALDAAVKALNQNPQMAERNLEFSIDKESGKVVVKITDRNTGEVIRQIPSKETLALAQELKKGAGHLFSAKA